MTILIYLQTNHYIRQKLGGILLGKTVDGSTCLMKLLKRYGYAHWPIRCILTTMMDSVIHHQRAWLAMVGHFHSPLTQVADILLLLMTGQTNTAKKWLEFWHSRFEGLKDYTKRIFKSEGIFLPHVFPYGSGI